MESLESARAYLFADAEDSPEDRAEIERLRATRYPGLRSPDGWEAVTDPEQCADVLASLLQYVPWLSVAELRLPDDPTPGGAGFSIVRLGPFYVVSTYPRPQGEWVDGGCLYQAPVRDRRFEALCYQSWS